VNGMDPTDNRLYGMLQFLIAHHVAVEDPPPANPRGVVELQDALDALMQVAIVLDQHTQEGDIPPSRGVFAGAMLMVVRDYIQPLPIPPEIPEDSPDPVTRDLHDLVGRLRALHVPDFPPDQ
jgi:hypothetical protein